MALYLKDGVLLVDDGKLAVSNACCCFQPSDHCSFECVDTVEAVISGFQTWDCDRLASIIPESYEEINARYSNLNGTYSTTDIGYGPSFSNISANFHLGTYGSASDKGVFMDRDITYQLDEFGNRINVSTVEEYAFMISVAAGCYFPDGPHPFGGLCVNPLFHIEGFAFDGGFIRVLTQYYANGVFSPIRTRVGGNIRYYLRSSFGGATTLNIGPCIYATDEESKILDVCGYSPTVSEIGGQYAYACNDAGETGGPIYYAMLDGQLVINLL